MTLTCATKIPELGIFWTRRQRNCKTCLETFMFIFSSNFSVFICWKFNCTEYTQIVWANRSAIMSKLRALTYGGHSWVDHRLGAFPSNNPPWRVQPPSVVGRIYLSAIKHTCKHNMYHLSYSLVKGTLIFYVNPKQKKRVSSQVLTAQSQRRIFDCMARKVVAESGWLYETVGGCITSKFLHCLWTLMESEAAMSLKQCACVCVLEHVCVFVCVCVCVCVHVCVRQTGKRRMSETEGQAFKFKSKRFYF